RDRPSGQGPPARPRPRRLHRHPHDAPARRRREAGRPHRHHPVRPRAGGRHARRAAPEVGPQGLHPRGCVPASRDQAREGGSMTAVAPIWLMLGHEVRLYWRQMAARTSHAVLLASVIGILAFMHLAAIPFAFGLPELMQDVSRIDTLAAVSGVALFGLM